MVALKGFPVHSFNVHSFNALIIPNPQGLILLLLFTVPFVCPGDNFYFGKPFGQLFGKETVLLTFSL